MGPRGAGAPRGARAVINPNPNNPSRLETHKTFLSESTRPTS